MMELADMRDLGSRAERRAGSTPVTRTTSSQASHRLRRLFMLCIKSHLALTPLLLLSKSQPLTLGCDLVLGANLAAAASILVWVPPPKGGFTLRRLQCSGQVNCPCANGLPVQWFFIPIVLPKGGRFAIITVSRDSKTSSAAVRMYAAAAV